MKPFQINTFLAIKLPAAWLCGVRLKEISSDRAVTTVKHRWINQNPFGSMYFAVQAMAAELTTGALVMQAIKDSKKEISMLVLNQKASFLKKAKGRIHFYCDDGEELRTIISKMVETNSASTYVMTSYGTDKNGDRVSTFEFEWTLKLK